MIIVIMGVAGSGKTRVGAALASALAWPFLDADDFHPPANIAKMSAGTPLTDEDREPWLATLRAALQSVQRERGNAVLACSALRRQFRAKLREGISDLRLVYLRADPALVRTRLAERAAHFMPSSLLESQFAALEEPDAALVLDAAADVDTLVMQIRRAFAT